MGPGEVALVLTMSSGHGVSGSPYIRAFVRREQASRQLQPSEIFSLCVRCPFDLLQSSVTLFGAPACITCATGAKEEVAAKCGPENEKEL